MKKLQKLPFYKAQKLADMLETKVSIIFPRMQNMARVAQTCAGIEPNYVLGGYGLLDGILEKCRKLIKNQTLESVSHMNSNQLEKLIGIDVTYVARASIFGG